MRITVQIPDDILAMLTEITGVEKKGPAIAKAVSEYVKREKAKQFGKLLREGAFDFPMTNEQLEQLG
jgi:hypothetical protein